MRKERDGIRGRETAESAALIDASVHPSAPRSLISSVISTHPPPALRLLAPSFTLSVSRLEKTEGKDGDERRKKGYSRGASQGALSEFTGVGVVGGGVVGGPAEGPKPRTERESGSERASLGCLIYRPLLLQTDV